MTATLTHRGPDEGSVVAVAPGGEGPSCVLGHRRLRILDLSSAGAQPMSNEDGTVQVTFNGEIYNFRALRRELETRGHTFRSSGDTEVIVHGYEEYGDGIVGRLDGMFAFALWDGRAGRLLLARDRLGKKPLFLASVGSRLLFGSEIKALRAAPGFDPAVDLGRVPELLAWGGVPWPRTMFEGVRQLPPATFVWWDPKGGAGEPQMYWRPKYADPSASHVSWAEAVGSTRELLHAAVERRTVADVPLGVLLSGGVDSSVIVALMARLGLEIRTFTAGIAGDVSFDERRFARVVAERFGTEHIEVTVDSAAADLLDLVLHHTDEPFADSSALPTYLIAKAARNHVTVALTGDGGDDVFAGYNRFRAALASARVPKAVQRLGGAAVRALPRTGRYLDTRSRAERFLSRSEAEPELRYRDWVGVFDETQLRRVLSPEYQTGLESAAFAAFDYGLREAPPAPLLHRLLAVNLRTYLPNDLLVKMDRMTMAVSLEARSPLLDTAVIEHVAALPASYKADSFRTKRLLRAVAADLLPREIVRRPKHGFGVPVGAWFRGELAEPFEDLVLNPAARSAEVLNPSGVAELYREHRDGTAEHGHRLWSLFALESWLRSVERPGTP